MRIGPLWDTAAVAFVQPKAGRNLQPRAVAGEKGMQIVSLLLS